MKAANKKLFLTIAVSVLVMAIVFVFFRLNPEKFSFFPKCPFLVATGYQCPGCGSQRAIHHLLHFDVATAFRYNPMVVILLPYVFLGIYLEYFGGKKRHPKLSAILFGRWAALILLVGIIAFWIGRNC